MYMKTFRYCLFTLCVMFSVTVFAQTKGAAKYNNQIVNHQHKIVKKFMKLFISFEHAEKEKMDQNLDKLIETIDVAIQETKTMSDFDGDADLRDGAVELFSFYENSVKSEYPEMIKLIANNDRSEEDNEKLEEFAQKLIKEEEEFDQKFEDIQIDFARRHGLKLVVHKN